MKKKLFHDIHFWIGNESSQDEYGTAAYKTVELSDLLGRIPQYREIQGFESPRFHSYFPNGITLLSGGIDSGFRHVDLDDYKPKLFWVKGKNLVHVTEVKLTCDSLNEGDAFVLDAGKKVFVWHGKSASFKERTRSLKAAKDIKCLRKDCTLEELEHDGSEEFWKLLGGKTKIHSAEEGGEDLEDYKSNIHDLFLLSDSSGKLKFSKVSSGKIEKKISVQMMQ